jgi:hypothetical protein
LEYDVIEAIIETHRLDLFQVLSQDWPYLIADQCYPSQWWEKNDPLPYKMVKKALSFDPEIFEYIQKHPTIYFGEENFLNLFLMGCQTDIIFQRIEMFQKYNTYLLLHICKKSLLSSKFEVTQWIEWHPFLSQAFGTHVDVNPRYTISFETIHREGQTPQERLLAFQGIIQKFLRFSELYPKTGCLSFISNTLVELCDHNYVECLKELFDFTQQNKMSIEAKWPNIKKHPASAEFFDFWMQSAQLQSVFRYEQMLKCVLGHNQDDLFDRLTSLDVFENSFSFAIWREISKNRLQSPHILNGIWNLIQNNEIWKQKAIDHWERYYPLFLEHPFEQSQLHFAIKGFLLVYKLNDYEDIVHMICKGDFDGVPQYIYDWILERSSELFQLRTSNFDCPILIFKSPQHVKQNVTLLQKFKEPIRFCHVKPGTLEDHSDSTLLEIYDILIKNNIFFKRGWSQLFKYSIDLLHFLIDDSHIYNDFCLLKTLLINNRIDLFPPNKQLDLKTKTEIVSWLSENGSILHLKQLADLKLISFSDTKKVFTPSHCYSVFGKDGFLESFAQLENKNSYWGSSSKLLQRAILILVFEIGSSCDLKTQTRIKTNLVTLFPKLPLSNASLTTAFLRKLLTSTSPKLPKFVKATFQNEIKKRTALAPKP